MAVNAFGDEIVDAPRAGVNAFGDPILGATPAGPAVAKGYADQFAAGLQSSSLGLAIRGKLPSQQLGEDATWDQRLVHNVGAIAGDIPAMAVGGALALPTGPVGMGAASFALPMAIREGLMEAYGNNHALSWKGFAEIALASIKGGAKGAVIGAATAGAGGVVGRAVLGSGGGKVAAGAAGLSAELGTLTTTSAALEGHMPTWQDFGDNAVLLGGFKAAGHVAKGMRAVFAETGKSPAEVLADAAKDPTIALDLKPVEAKVTSEPMVDLYHGSPHEFAKFEMEKVGTGEGAQAYGHGLYFAEHERVASSYMDARAPNQKMVLNMYQNRLAAGLEPAVAKEQAIAWGNKNPQIGPEAAEAAFSSAQLYKVQVPQRVVDTMLDYDARFKDQTPAAQAALVKVLGETPAPEASISTLYFGLARKLARQAMDAPAGVTEPMTSLASAALREAGIGGIKYKDAGSRAPGHPGLGTRNFVLFDHNDVTIVERNGFRIPGVNEKTDVLKFAEQSGIQIATTDKGPHYADGVLYLPEMADAAFAAKYGNSKADVLSHELGHGLLHKWEMTGEIKGPHYVDLRAELRAVSQKFRASVWDKARGHAEKSGELMADGLAVWMTRPEARAEMPLFEKMLGWRLDELKRAPTEAATLPRAYQPLALEERIKAALGEDPRTDQIRANLKAATEPPKLGDTADSVKYEYITDKASAVGVLRAVTAEYQSEITAQTRGVVTNKATALEALKQISDGAVDPHMIGEAGNAAEIYARAHILKGATNHAVAELAKIAHLSDAELTPAAKLSALAALERVAMLKAELEGVGAEAGRALQILGAIKRDPELLGEANTLLRIAERKGKLQDIAALAAALKDPAQLIKFADGYTKATTMEKVLEAWKAGLVSGPQTHLANILGNLGKWTLDVPESILAASLVAAGRAAKGDPLTMAQFKARAFSPLIGLQLGARDALHVAAEIWRQEGPHLEKADVYRTAIEGNLGEAVRVPFRFLQMEDALFRTTAERAEAYKMAVDRVVKEGLHPETVEGREAIVKYTENPAFGLTEKAGVEAMAQVQKAGAEAVFSERLGPRMEMVQRAMAGSAMGFVVPFVRTPANLVSWAIQHVPGLNLVSARWREDFAAGGERQARAISRVVIGTGITMTAMALAQDGLLTGGGTFDKEQGSVKRAAGWQPYSVLVNDKYYSYQRMEPVAKVIGMAADLIELQKATKDKGDQAKIGTMLTLMFANATISTTYLSGLANVIKGVTDPERYGEGMLEQYATSVVPKIAGQVAAVLDPHKREVDGVLDAIQSQIPIFREKLLPKRDVWGEPAQNDRWFEVMPVSVSEVSKDKVRTEAARLQLAIQDAPKFLTEKGPFKPGEKRIELDPEQRDIMRQVTGHNAMAILSPIVNAPDWARIPDFAKAEIYKEVFKGTAKQGQYAALPPDAASRVRLREQIVNKIIKQTQEAQQ